MLRQVGQIGDIGETDRDLSGCDSDFVGHASSFGGIAVLMSGRTLTGLPITGAILGRQHNETYMGMQAFAVGTMFLGFLFLLGARNVLARANGTWRY